MAPLAGQRETQGNLHKTNGSGPVALKRMLGREFLRKSHSGVQKKQWTCRKGFWPSSLREMQPSTTLPSASLSNRSILLIKSMQPPTTVHPVKATFSMPSLVREGRSLISVTFFFSIQALHISQASLILGLEEGYRLPLKDIQAHVREDMQDGTLTKEYEDEALKELEEGRNLGNVGMRTTTTGLGVDARYTTSRIGEEVCCSVFYHILCLPLFS